MLQRRGNQIYLLVLTVFYFSPEKMPTVFIWVHRQLIKLVGACSGERSDLSDTVVISVPWLTGAPFEAALSPWHVVALHQDGKS